MEGKVSFMVFVISSPLIYTVLTLEKETGFCKCSSVFPYISLQDFCLECLRKDAILEIKLFSGQT